MPRTVLLMDCGTRLRRNCLLMLHSALMGDESLVGTTPCARVMTPDESFEVSRMSLAFDVNTRHARGTWTRALRCVQSLVVGPCAVKRGAPCSDSETESEYQEVVALWVSMVLTQPNALVRNCMSRWCARFWLSPAPAQGYEFVSACALDTATRDTTGCLGSLPGVL
jgi:hypothetical protein